MYEYNIFIHDNLVQLENFQLYTHGIKGEEKNSLGNIKSEFTLKVASKVEGHILQYGRNIITLIVVRREINTILVD